MVNKELIKEIIDIFASGCTLALVWVLIATFLVAFTSPGMKVTVTINQYGEAWFELPLLILIGIGAVRDLFRESGDLKSIKKART